MADLHDIEFLGSQFALELESIEMARFSGCSGLGYTTEIVEYQDSLMDGKLVTRKRPGRTKFDDIVLKRGLSPDASLIEWHQKVTEGMVERSNGSIVIYDMAGMEVGRWNFERGWPSGWSASDLDAGTDDVMIEELTIAHEGLFKA
jgi:phage tail-like protein|tara:strand:+ start:442 stop:879 length:438 start_codon:yes stop_codon:yes gene_type:complete